MERGHSCAQCILPWRNNCKIITEHETLMQLGVHAAHHAQKNSAENELVQSPIVQNRDPEAIQQRRENAALFQKTVETPFVR